QMSGAFRKVHPQHAALRILGQCGMPRLTIWRLLEGASTMRSVAQGDATRERHWKGRTRGKAEHATFTQRREAGSSRGGEDLLEEPMLVARYHFRIPLL